MCLFLGTVPRNWRRGPASSALLSLSQVDILDVDVITDWGWNMVRPGAGSLKTFAGGFLTIALDLERRVVKPPWGGEVPWNVTGTGASDHQGVGASALQCVCFVWISVYQLTIQMKMTRHSLFGSYDVCLLT